MCHRFTGPRNFIPGCMYNMQNIGLDLFHGDVGPCSRISDSGRGRRIHAHTVSICCGGTGAYGVNDAKIARVA
jgi:hypothetical protein